MREARLSAVLLLIGVLFAAGCSDSSSNDSILSSREECDGVPECVSVTASELNSIAGDGIHVLHFACPDEAPNIHNIDVDQNDNVNFVVTAWSENAVTVKFFKQTPEMDAFYQAFLGCSPEPYTDEERFAGRSSVPDSLPDEASEPPAPENFRTPDACDAQIPDCVNKLTRRHRIGHLKTHKVDVVCPDTHPWYAVYTDTVSSFSVTVIENPFNKLRIDGRGDSFFVTNLSAIHDHHWQISIACSGGCEYAPGGCPCGDKKFGCHNDPGCRTTVSRTTRCTPDESTCWTVWEEECPDGEQWECNTTLGWVCCQSCT